MKKSVFLFLLAAMSLTASAQDPVKIGDFWYTFATYNPTRATLVADPNGGTYSGDLVIPAVVEHDGQECLVAYIGPRAFSGTDILSVTIKGKLNDNGYGLYIQERAFSHCKSLSSVKIENGVTSIGYCAFYNCPNLSNVIVGDNVYSIGDQAFQKCSSLTSVTLGKTVRWIGASAFVDCDNLKDFYCFGEKFPRQDEGRIFEESQFENLTLHVPEAYYDTYIFNDGRDNYPWQHFGNVEKMQNTTLEKCAKPTISYANGTVSFACETPDVEYKSTVEYVETEFSNASNFPAPSKFRVKVMAVKSGYESSDVVEKEFDLPSYVGVKTTGNYKEGDVNKDGNVNVADHVKLANAMK
jgi:hypothetical protein